MFFEPFAIYVRPEVRDTRTWQIVNVYCDFVYQGVSVFIFPVIISLLAHHKQINIVCSCLCLRTLLITSLCREYWLQIWNIADFSN